MIIRQIEILLGKRVKGFPDKNGNFDVSVEDAGEGEYIAQWNIEGVDKPEIKDLPVYNEEQYFGLFPKEKSVKERLEAVEEEIKNLKKDK